MKIAILEITTYGHYTLVESIAKIYASVASNEIMIFTTKKGEEALQGIDNEQIKTLVVDEPIETFFKNIQGFDKIFIPTLESYSRTPYHIMQVFLKINFNCPIYYFIHNVDFWFQQSIFDKIRNVLYRLSNVNDFIYRLKVYFKYASINERIIQKVKLSGGKLVALTDAVGQELAKYVGLENVAIIPFSIFDEQITDKSSENARLRVCITGLLNTTRRDYDSVFKMIKENENFFKSNIVWDFLGGNPHNYESQQLVEKIQVYQKLGHDIRFYEDYFLSMQDYDTNLSHADLILGNMHMQQGVNSKYGKSKETGIIFTMIKAAKVGILPSEYPADEALKTSILTFKSYEDVAIILKKLIENREELKHLKIAAHRNSKKFTPLSIYKRLESHK